MNFQLLQLQNNQTQADISLGDFAKLVEYLRTKSDDSKQVPTRPFNEFTSSPIDCNQQFQVKSLNTLLKLNKIPDIVRDYTASPNKCTFCIRLINNLFLIVNTQNEKITAFQPPPCQKCYYDLPDTKILKKWGSKQDFVELKHINCDEIQTFCVSDFGDTLIAFNTYQIIFSFKNCQFSKQQFFSIQNEDSLINYKYNYSAIIPPQTNNYLTFDQQMIISQTKYSKNQVFIVIKQINIDSLFDDSDKKQIQTINKQIFIQNQQEDIYVIQTQLMNNNSCLYMIINDIILQYAYSFNISQTVVDNQVINQFQSLINQKSSTNRVNQQLQPSTFAEQVQDNQFTSQADEDQIVFNQQQNLPNNSQLQLLNKIYIRRQLQKFNIAYQSRQQVQFINFSQSQDNNLLVALFTDFFIVFKHPLLFTIKQIQIFNQNMQYIKSIIYQNRTLLIKQGTNSYNSFNINIIYDKQQLVVYPDRFCVSTMDATVYQALSYDQSNYSIEQLYFVLQFIFCNITESQLIILQNQFLNSTDYQYHQYITQQSNNNQNQLLSNLFLEQFQLDLITAQMISQLINKFIQQLIKEVKNGNQINFKKLIHFKQFVNSFNQNPLQTVVLQEFIAQFSAYYLEKHNLNYFQTQLEHYQMSNSYEKSVLMLNFEENFNQAQQIVGFISIISGISTRGFNYINKQLLQLSLLLFALSIDIAFAKNIKIPQIIYNKYLNILKYFKFDQLVNCQNVLQLPALLILINDNSVKLYNGGKQFKQIICKSNVDLLEQLYVHYAYILDNSSNTNSFSNNNIVNQFKQAILQNQTYQQYSNQLVNSKFNSYEQQFFYEYLAQSQQFQKFFQLSVDNNSKVSLNTIADGFQNSFSITQQNYNFCQFLLNVIYSVSNNHVYCQLQSEKSVMQLQNIMMSSEQNNFNSIFNQFAFAMATFNQELFEQSVVALLQNNNVQHCQKYLDYVVNLFDLKVIQEGTNPLQQKRKQYLIMLRAGVRDRQALFKQEMRELQKSQMTKSNINKSNINNQLTKSKFNDNLTQTQIVQFGEDQNNQKNNLQNSYQNNLYDSQLQKDNPQVLPSENFAFQNQQEQINQQTYINTSGMQDVNDSMINKIQNYDQDKEISMCQYEGVEMLPLPNQNMQYVPQVDQSQSLLQLSQNNLIQTQHPMQIKRIKMSELGSIKVNQQQVPSIHQTAMIPPSCGLIANSVPIQQTLIQPRFPIQHQSSDKYYQNSLQKPIQITQPQYTNKNQQIVYPDNQSNQQLPLVTYGRKPQMQYLPNQQIKPKTPITQPIQEDPRQIQDWQKTQYVQQPIAQNRMVHQQPTQIVQLQQPQQQHAYPVQQVGYTQIPPRQQNPQSQQQLIQIIQPRQPQYQQVQQQQQTQPQFQQAPQQPSIYEPQQQQNQQNDVNIPIQNVKRNYKVVNLQNMQKVRNTFDYNLIKDAIGPQIDKNADLALNDNVQQPTMGQIQKALDQHQFQPNPQQTPKQQILPQQQQNFSNMSSVSSIHSNKGQFQYPAYQSNFQPVQYPTPAMQVFPQVCINSSIVQLQSPQVKQQNLQLPQDDVLNSIDNLLQRAEGNKQQTKDFMLQHGRTAQTPSKDVLQQYQNTQQNYVQQSSFDNNSDDNIGLTQAMGMFNKK